MSTSRKSDLPRRLRRHPRQRVSLVARLRALQGWTRVIVFGGLIGAVVAIVLATGSTAYAIQLENNDGFCASCHTQPETQYYQQSLAQQPATLAAFHTQKQVRCIDCHSGGEPFGRLNGVAQGAQDLLSYYSHNYHSPAVTTSKLGDDSCIKCHADVLTQRTMQNHFHYFLAQWQSADPNAAHCIDCHAAHPTSDATQQYLVVNSVQAQCDSCHSVMR